MVLRAKNAVLADIRRARHMIELENKVRDSKPFLRAEYLQLLFRFGGALDSALRRWEFLEIGLPSNDLYVLLAEIDGFEQNSRSLPVSEAELLRFAVQNVMEETIANHTIGIVVRDGISRFAVVVSTLVFIDIENLAEEIREHISQYTKCTVSLGVGLKAEQLTDLALSYEQALAALSYTFYTGGNSVYVFKEKNSKSAWLRPSPEKEKEWLFALRSGNVNLALEWLQNAFDEMSGGDTPPDPAWVRGRLREWASLAVRLFSEMMPAESKEWDQRLAEIDGAGGSASLKELLSLLKQLCESGCQKILREQSDEGAQAVARAKTFIRENLHLNLTVNDCANHVFLSGSYFASLFKKLTGTTVGQFMTAERMERAKTMLVEGRQVQEIAQALGYEDRQYFSELFKKHTGMTPSEFKSNYGGGPK